jgi:hypothetical protein
VMFLGELEEVLEATQPAEFQRCMVPLFRQIACSMNSSHFQVKSLMPTIKFQNSNPCQLQSSLLFTVQDICSLLLRFLIPLLCIHIALLHRWYYIICFISLKKIKLWCSSTFSGEPWSCFWHMLIWNYI